MILSYYLIRKRVARLLEHPPGRKRGFIPWEKVHRVLLVYHQKDQEAVEVCIDQLRSMKKQVKRLIWTETLVSEQYSDLDTIWCVKKELGWWAFPSDETVKACLDLKVDMLLDLTSEEYMPLLYLVLSHPVGLKIGLKKERGDYYDFALSPADRKDICFAFEQILFYLQTFRL